MDDGADLVSAMIFVALNRLEDVHAEVRDWASTLGATERRSLVATSSAAWKRPPRA